MVLKLNNLPKTRVLLYVKVKQSSSNSCVLEIGVPQGSILGPLLFILFTYDLEEIAAKYGLSIHFYADDTQIYFSFDVNSGTPDLSRVTECFDEIKIWMSNNFLKLNGDKTKVMEIGYYESQLQHVSIDNMNIEPIPHHKNLGFIFDHQLNMDEQIKTVSQICYLNLRSLRRIACHLSFELKIQLVNSNILSFLDYCNAVYGGISDRNLAKLQKIQNNAVRFIYRLVG